jgi:hypothetical protein
MNKQFISRKTRNYILAKSPTALTIIGSVGVIVTGILAVRATPKALQLIDEEIEQKNTEISGEEAPIEKLPAKDVLLVAWKPYVPAILMGISSIACFWSANILNKHSQAALTSAYAATNQLFKDYRKTLIGLHGEEADEEVWDALPARYSSTYHEIGLDRPDRKCLWYDEISGRSVEAYEREIMDAEYHINRNFTMRGYASLNEFYEFLGLEPTSEGEKMGWSMCDGETWLDFTHRLINNGDDGGLPCYEIDFDFTPEEGFMEGWE